MSREPFFYKAWIIRMHVYKCYTNQQWKQETNYVFYEIMMIYKIQKEIPVREVTK
jgi:hypothetical protein